MADGPLQIQEQGTTQKTPVRDGLDSLQRFALGEDQDTLQELDELFERFADRLTLSNLALAERYAKGHLNVLVEARCEAIDFNVVFTKENAAERIGDSCISGERNAVRSGASNAQLAIGAEEHPGDDDDGVDLHRRGSYRHDAVVLVEDVQHVERPQGRVPSLATFKPHDESLGSGADAIYFGHGSGFKSFGVKRKPAVPVWLFAVRSNQITHKIIQSASQVVDRIADDDAGLAWDGFLDRRAEDILSGLSVSLSNEGVWARLEEPLQKDVEIMNVAFGPFNF